MAIPLIAAGLAAAGSVAGALLSKNKAKAQTGSMNALSPEQTRIMQMIQNATMVNSPSLWQDMAQRATGPLQTAYNIDPRVTQQYYQDTIYNPGLAQFTGVTMPKINETMSKNFWSTARQKAQQGATQDFFNNMSQQRSNLYYQDELAKRQALENAYGRKMASQTGLNNVFLAPLGVKATDNYAMQGSNSNVLGGIASGLQLGGTVGDMVGKYGGQLFQNKPMDVATKATPEDQRLSTYGM